MPRWLSTILTAFPPIVLLSIAGLLLHISRSFRRSFGASNELPAGALLVIGLFFILHIGYFAAPFLLSTDHRGLTLGLTAPIAALATLALLGATATGNLRGMDTGQPPAWFAATIILLLVTYWSPVAASLSARPSTAPTTAGIDADR